MNAEDVARARAWIDPVLDNWCEEWSVLRRRDFGDQLAVRLAHAVLEKGMFDIGVCLEGILHHGCDCARNLQKQVHRVPEPLEN